MNTLRRPDGRSVAYSDAGAPDGQPVLFLSGTPGSRLVPEPSPGWFGELGARVIGVDRPGYGGSAALPGRRVVDLVDDLVAVLDAVGAERAHVVGGSGGGPYALALAAQAPGRVAHVAVQVGAVLLPEDVTAMTAHNQRVHELATDRAALSGLLAQVRGQMLGQGIGSVLTDVSEEDRALLQARAEQMTAMLADALAPGADGMVDDDRALWGLDWGFAPEDVTHPVRWYHGEDDVMVPITAARRYAQRLPDCRFTSWRGEGHLLSPARSQDLAGAADYRGRVTPQELADLARLRRARDLMDRDYAAPLDVPAMARTALMSPSHFSRRFRAAYGETPYTYLMTRRIERAQALLRQGISVTDACLAVGCTSLGSFSSRFTEVVGETPSHYRGRDHTDLQLVPECAVKALTRPRR